MKKIFGILLLSVGLVACGGPTPNEKNRIEAAVAEYAKKADATIMSGRYGPFSSIEYNLVSNKGGYSYIVRCYVYDENSARCIMFR